jgi:hypothetical protein
MKPAEPVTRTTALALPGRGVQLAATARQSTAAWWLTEREEPMAEVPLCLRAACSPNTRNCGSEGAVLRVAPGVLASRTTASSAATNRTAPAGRVFELRSEARVEALIVSVDACETQFTKICSDLGSCAGVGLPSPAALMF